MNKTSILRETDSELRSTAWWFSGSARLDFPRARRSFPKTLGFVGSEDLYRILLPECPIHLLTPANWRPSLEAGLFDLVLFEPCLREVTGSWSGNLFDAAAGSEGLEPLFRAAREVGVPTACWITSDASYLDLQASFATLADATFCADHALADALARKGADATHLPQLIQPSLHNPVLDLADRSGMPEMLFLGWTSILSRPDLAEALKPLVPMGLRIAEPKARIRLLKRTSIPGLQEAFLGTVALRDRMVLLKRAKILIQAADDLTPRRTAERMALEAAACQCVVLHHGRLEPTDLRSAFVKSFESWEDLRAFAIRLQTERLLWLRLAQLGWRIAQEEYSATKAMAAIFSACGFAVDAPAPCASVVTPTIRPELLGKALDQFRRQSWPNKELVVVANSNAAEGWPTELLEPDNCEQIVFVPREHWAGAALNVGARRTRGEYVFRMDDDDHYGANYLRDMMLHARSTGADVLSKQAEFVYSGEHGALFRRPGRAFPPTVFSSSDFSYEMTPMAGFTMAIRREIALCRGYPELFFGFADSRFLLREKEKGDLTMVLTDNLNAVVERRADPRSHTFQIRNRWERDDYQRLEADIDEIMV